MTLTLRTVLTGEWRCTIEVTSPEVGKYDPDHALRVLSATHRAWSKGAVQVTSHLRQQGFPIEVPDFYLLHALSQAPDGRLTAGEVAELAGSPKSTTSDTVKGLENLGLVTRVRPEHDRRQMAVVLTAQGYDFVTLWEPVVMRAVTDFVLNKWGREHYERVALIATIINVEDDLTGFVAEYLLGIVSGPLGERTPE